MSKKMPEEKLKEHDDRIAKLDRTASSLKMDTEYLKKASRKNDDMLSNISREILGSEDYGAEGLVGKIQRHDRELKKIREKLPDDLNAMREDFQYIARTLRNSGRWMTVIFSVLTFLLGGVLWMGSKWEQIVEFFRTLSSTSN